MRDVNSPHNLLMTVYDIIWQDVDIIEEGGKHTLILYNCKVSMTGEVGYTAANAKCSANLKVKGKPTAKLLHLLSAQQDFSFASP